jgi:hypothetical protein
VTTRVFEISVKGDASELLRAQLDDVAVSVDRSVTRMQVAIRDASALHGILAHIDALGLELLGVHRLDEPPPDRSPGRR